MLSPMPQGVRADLAMEIPFLFHLEMIGPHVIAS
jgi:hypothetical protein